LSTAREAERLYVSVTEAARILACHPVTVRRQIAAGEIPARRIGRNYRIPYESLAPETGEEQSA
jgi:excisionase family DNA binding protein